MSEIHFVLYVKQPHVAASILVVVVRYRRPRPRPRRCERIIGGSVLCGEAATSPEAFTLIQPLPYRRRPFRKQLRSPGLINVINYARFAPSQPPLSMRKSSGEFS